MSAGELTPIGCRCAHPIEVHEHYRVGEECAWCGCPRYRRRPGRLQRALEGARFHLYLLAGLVHDIGRRPPR